MKVTFKFDDGPDVDREYPQIISNISSNCERPIDCKFEPDTEYLSYSEAMRRKEWQNDCTAACNSKK